MTTPVKESLMIVHSILELHQDKVEELEAIIGTHQARIDIMQCNVDTLLECVNTIQKRELGELD